MENVKWDGSPFPFYTIEIKKGRYAMKFYFAGAIRSSRDKVDIYIKINELLKRYGTVLDEHVANPNVNIMEKNLTLEEIYNRDVNWIKECDMVVAEVSAPSLGVGYELAYAENLGKAIICICDDSINLSAMIGGNKNLKIVKYKNDKDLISKLTGELQRKDE